MEENEITGTVVDSAIEVHRSLGGPGLLESVYEEVKGLCEAPTYVEPMGRMSAFTVVSSIAFSERLHIISAA